MTKQQKIDDLLTIRDEFVSVLNWARDLYDDAAGLADGSNFGIAAAKAEKAVDNAVFDVEVQIMAIDRDLAELGYVA